MRVLKENLLVQFSVVSLIAMAIIAVVFVVFLSNPDCHYIGSVVFGLIDYGKMIRASPVLVNMKG